MQHATPALLIYLCAYLLFNVSFISRFFIYLFIFFGLRNNSSFFHFCLKSLAFRLPCMDVFLSDSLCCLNEI